MPWPGGWGPAPKPAPRPNCKTTPVERAPARAPTPLAVLMFDGWLVRPRGPGWGKKKTAQPRVAWHEWKTGVYYRQEQAGRTVGGRGVLAEKIVLGWQGEPLELDRTYCNF